MNPLKKFSYYFFIFLESTLAISFGVVACLAFVQRHNPDGPANIIVSIILFLLTLVLVRKVYKDIKKNATIAHDRNIATSLNTNKTHLDSKKGKSLTQKDPLQFQSSSPILSVDSSPELTDMERQSEHIFISDAPILEPNLDYAITLFLNAYRKGSSLLDNDKYWGYLKYNCGIESPRKFHEMLIENDYFGSPSFIDCLSSYTVSELKKILDSMGFKKSGNKAELIERINSNLSQAEKEALCKKEKIFVLTTKGEQFIKEHSDYIQLKKWHDGSITLEDYIMAKKEIPFNASFNDVIWYIYNKRQRDYYISKEYDKLSSIYSDMAMILINEKRFEKAIYYSVKSLYLELSGIEQYENLQYYKKNTYSIKDMLEIYYPVLPVFAINLFKKTMDYYNESILERVLDDTKIPFSISSKSDLLHFIEDILSANELSEEDYRKVMTLRYKKFLKSLHN